MEYEGFNISDLRTQDAQVTGAYITGSCENFITLSPSCPLLNKPITLVSTPCYWFWLYLPPSVLTFHSLLWFKGVSPFALCAVTVISYSL